MAPLPGEQQQASQQAAEEQLGAEVAQPRDQYHGAVDHLAAVLLDQCHHALIELVQIRPAEEQPGQGQEAQAGDQASAVALVAQAAVQAQPDQHGQRAGDDPGIQPEPLWQGQAHGGAGGPARQQVGDRPAGTGHHADGNEARQRHVEHARDHGQHGP
ncbi:hypothetical protein D3C76_1076080 [compost metagenome]